MAYGTPMPEWNEGSGYNPAPQMRQTHNAPAPTSGGQWGQAAGQQYRYNDPGLMDLEGFIGNFLTSPIQTGPGGATTPSGGSSGGSGSSANRFANTDPLGPYRGGIGSGGAAGLDSYMNTRDSMAPANYFKNYAEGIDPNAHSDELRQYAQGVDPNAAANPLLQFLQNFDPTGGMNQYFNDRIAKLQADPFSDQILAARRTGALDDFERDRQIAKKRTMEQLAAQGHDQSSGLVARALADVDRQYDTQRASRTNELVNEEFAMRRENETAADNLQLQRGQLNMQGQQLVGQMTGQVGQLMQQGLGMQNSLRIALTEAGLNEQNQQTQIIGQVSQLMAQGMQMNDALQMAVAQNATAEQGNRGQYMGALAGAEANVFGSRLSLEGQLAQARATGGASRAANELGWAQFGETQRQNRLDAAMKLPYLGTNPQDVIDRSGY